MISYLPSILSFWSCALASKTCIYSPIYLGGYLYNKFLASLPGIVLNCVFKSFSFSFIYFCLFSSKKKKKKILTFVSVSILICFCRDGRRNHSKSTGKKANEKFFHSTKPQSTIMHRLPAKCTRQLQFISSFAQHAATF